VMTASPLATGPLTPAVEVARLMRDEGISAVIRHPQNSAVGNLNRRPLHPTHSEMISEPNELASHPEDESP
jgi:hypothetical protein